MTCQAYLQTGYMSFEYSILIYEYAVSYVSHCTYIVNFDIARRKVLSNNETRLEQSLRILIGSVGSKSNKVDYVKGLLTFLSQHSNMSKSVLWTPSTTRVASLYSAADVYAINSQVIRGHIMQAVAENNAQCMHVI